MFIARTLRAPQKPSAADQAALNNILRDSTPSGELDSLIQNSCGARVHSDPIPLRTGGGSGGLEGIGGSETVQVGLTPHPGMTPAEQQQASTAVSAMTSAITRCLSPLARKNPKILGATIRVGAATMGDGTPTRLTILPTGTSDEVKTCVTGAIAPLLIGDTKNAQLLFDVRIDKTPK